MRSITILVISILLFSGFVLLEKNNTNGENIVTMTGWYETGGTLGQTYLTLSAGNPLPKGRG